MKTSFPLSALSLAIGLNLFLFAGQAFATKLTAAPLPHESDFSDGQEIVIPPSATTFPRRPSYQEEEQKKKDDAKEAAKKADLAKQAAIQAQLKTRQDRVDAYKKQLQTAVDANNDAVALGKQGRWQEAIAQHEKAVQYDPRNSAFRINLSAARTAYAQTLMAKGDYSGGASYLRKALAAAQDNGLAAKLLAQCIRKQGQDPGSADVRLAIGDKLAAMGDLQCASIEYAQAMQIEQSARTYIKLGDMAYRYGQVSQATNWYRQAIVKDPDCGAAHRQLGFLDMARNDLTSAAASLRKAVILDSKDTAAGQALTEIWRKQVAANPLLAENHLGLAGALQLTGDFVGAESEYSKLAVLDPKNPGLEAGRASLQRAYQHARAERHREAATTLFNQGLRRESLAEINQAVMLEPKNANYQFLLGECLESNGDYQGAHQAYLTCVLIDPENNKEAAARMKAMQDHAGMSNAQAGAVAGQMANRMIGQQQQQQYAQQQAPQQPINQPVQAGNVSGNPNGINGYFPRKNMYEGGSGQASMPPQMSFRTHDEPQDISQAQARPTGAASDGAFAAPKNMAVNDALSKVAEAEAQRDYNSAVSILRQILSDNLQNADIHHRLGVNLMAAGEITESVSEFRIASALAPNQKAYAEDLARAMEIHKRSLMSDAGGAAGGGTSGVAK